MEEEKLCKFHAVRVLCVEMKMDCLVSQSTITWMVVYPSESSNCFMRSMEIEFHGADGIGSCKRVP